ncbi:hypothetical protein ACLKOZ_18420 [Arthrobacter sp. R4]|uniref:SipW-dependent-type signal peptide-containing protein n=1 Tax=Arthrobacter sp. R4 TaxID=644417 RepID=UPI003ED948B2
MSRPATGTVARAMGVVTALTLGVTLAPGSAFAAFSGMNHVATPFSAATLPAPAAHQTTVTIECALVLSTIAVTRYDRVLNANYHELKIYSGSSTTPVHTGDLSKPAQRKFSSAMLFTGSWRVEIAGQYRVPGSTNVWTGPPFIKYLQC